mgnify:CR=1 FL=1
MIAEKMKTKLISLTVPGYSVYDETEGRFISQQRNCTKFLVKPDFLTQFQTLALKKIVAITHPDNLASQKVLKKAGLVYCGEVEYQSSPEVSKKTVCWFVATELLKSV